MRTLFFVFILVLLTSCAVPSAVVVSQSPPEPTASDILNQKRDTAYAVGGYPGLIALLKPMIAQDCNMTVSDSPGKIYMPRPELSYFSNCGVNIKLLAWSLYANGQYSEAIPYLQQTDFSWRETQKTLGRINPCEMDDALTTDFNSGMHRKLSELNLSSDYYGQDLTLKAKIKAKVSPSVADIRAAFLCQVISRDDAIRMPAQKAYIAYMSKFGGNANGRRSRLFVQKVANPIINRMATVDIEFPAGDAERNASREAKAAALYFNASRFAHTVGLPEYVDFLMQESNYHKSYIRL